MEVSTSTYRACRERSTRLNLRYPPRVTLVLVTVLSSGAETTGPRVRWPAEEATSA